MIMSATVVQYPIEAKVLTKPASSSVHYAEHPEAVVKVPTKSSFVGERLVVVLDMDECLVHSRFAKSNTGKYRQDEKNRPEKYDEENQHEIETFTVEMEDGEKVIVHKRPGLDHFLQQVAKHFDVYVFTAGLEIYGNAILNALDPQNMIFKKRFFRHSCTLKKGLFLKDLASIVDNNTQDLSKIVLVDNNPVSFLPQPSNGIPVPSFYDDPKDKTLESLLKVLLNLQNVPDVRPRLHQLFRLADLLNEHRQMFWNS